MKNDYLKRDDQFQRAIISIAIEKNMSEEDVLTQMMSFCISSHAKRKGFEEAEKVTLKVLDVIKEFFG